MIKLFLKVFLFIILFYSCHASKLTNPSNHGLLISMDKTDCRGKCPVYSVKIFQDGTVFYTGIKNVDRIGTFTKLLPMKKVEKVRNAFYNSYFFDFDSEYKSTITDLPTIYISFTHENITKQIRDYYGAPAQLKSLEEMIADIALNRRGWLQQ